MAEQAIEDTDSLPEGALIEVTMMVRLPVAATKAQIDEWLHHDLARQGPLSMDNPLFAKNPDVFGWSGLDWKDTGDVDRE